MRQNRRRNARTSPVNHRITFFCALLALLLAVGALSMLSIKSMVAKTAHEISRLESERDALRAELTRAQAKWTTCTSPERLDAALARHGLRMTFASGERIVSLRGQGRAGLGGAAATEVAANGKIQRN